MSKSRILLGMSGGTDSSVAAMLLQEQGYEVTGVTFRFFDETPDVPAFVQEARELAGKLNIEHYTVDARERFRKEVVDYFIDEYLAGRTPFPCVKCNSTLKWQLLLELLQQLNCEKMATGHYARLSEKDGRFYITEAADKDKDQTFFLWGLQQNILQKTVFPLGNLTKPDIRKIAAERGFSKIAARKDSMGICFCPGDYRDFLKKQQRLKPVIRKGDFVDENGAFLGRHESYLFYTVGQRYGLGISLNKPVFVKEIIPATNKVVLAPVDKMFRQEILVENYHLIDETDFSESCIIKIRYRNQATPGCVQMIDANRLRIALQEPVAAVAPGQSAVFYKDGKVLGGGIII